MGLSLPDLNALPPESACIHGPGAGPSIASAAATVPSVMCNYGLWECESARSLKRSQQRVMQFACDCLACYAEAG
jgi:hypothetical protein